jgi:signal transduction histidine kinase
MIRNVQEHPNTRDPEFFRRYGLVSYLGVPLVVQKILGVISFYTKEEHEFSESEIQFLSTLAGQAAIAIHNSQLYEELVKSNKVKDEFLSVMSHELRTPMSIVMGYVGIVADGMFGTVNEKQKEMLDKALGRARDQVNMVTAMLQATQLRCQESVMELCELKTADLLDRVKSSYQPPKKGIALAWDYSPGLPAINTDPEKLKQVLLNLIDNAFKFTKTGSVTVSARLAGRQGNGKPAQGQVVSGGPLRFVEFKVADTGIGIPQEMQEIIFNKFHQIDSSETRLFGGVGLGLYIVKNFTELLGGTVLVESEPGKGSEFTVTIPCGS